MATFKHSYTFDDVTLVPKSSNITSRSDISLRTKITKNLYLNNPLISSCMDTVTGAEMAIEMARNGGIGILHRFCSIEDQVQMVHQVKRAQNFIIENPYTIDQYETVEELRNQMDEKNTGSFLVIDKNAPTLLLGIVTKRDIRYQSFNALVKDIMTPVDSLVTASPDISLDQAKKIMRDYRIKKIPLVTHRICQHIDPNNSTIRLCEDFISSSDPCKSSSRCSPDAKNIIVGLICSRDIYENLERTYASLDNKDHLLVGAAVGANGDYLDRAKALVKAGVDILVLDTANGHNLNVVEATRTLKMCFPHIELISGNVATAEGYLKLVEAGADGVRCGVGNGSICTTRIVSGFGVPLLSTLLECKPYVKETGVPIISDGGTSGISGKMVKALAAGANTLMLGSTLAGADEAPGEEVLRNGKRMKHYRGMAGYSANISKRRKLTKDGKYSIKGFVPEGVEAFVECKGPVKGIIDQLIGGIKSGISYCGRDIDDLQRSAEFRIITSAGQKESRAHDVSIQ